MKASRRILIPLTLFLPLLAASPLRGNEYPGPAFSWDTVGAYTSTINVPLAEEVSNVSVFIRDATTQLGFDNNAMLLTSPSGTTRYLFDISTYQISGSSLYLTHFIDTASTIISSGSPPYAGSFRPGQSFSAFNGEWATGTWTLAVYNSRRNAGAVTNWSLFINAPTPVPGPTPYDHCPIHPGNSFVVPQLSVVIDNIMIESPEPGSPFSERVQNVLVNIENFVVGDSDLNNVGMYLISPRETIVALFEKYMLGEHALAGTWFDDSAPRNIADGIGPYVGRFRPSGNLSDFIDEPMGGEWRLVVFNDAGIEYPAVMNQWALEICPAYTTPTPAGPSPTPTSTPLVSCWNYLGPPLAWADVGWNVSTIAVAHAGFIDGMEVRLSLNCATDLAHLGVYLVSPEEDYLGLFEVGDLDGHVMYRTVFEDLSERRVNQGVAPYVGRYRPMANLSSLDGSPSAGIWQLLVYNSWSGNSGNVSNWDLRFCLAESAPTPTPSVIPTSSPTPSVTPASSPTPWIPTPSPPPMPVLASGDYDGDGTSDIGVFRAASGLWTVRGVGTSFFGGAWDVPASGDYNGDGTADIALFRPSSGLWAVHGLTRVYFGQSGDTPVPGDYTGDGFTDIGIFRPATGLWAVRGIPRIYFGTAGDIPVPGDYNGDGFVDTAVFRPSSGLWAIEGLTRFYFGTPGDLPLARDISGDGTADAGIFRASSGLWAIRGLTRFYFGGPGDYPVAADFLGDWTDYPGIFRQSSGLWAIRGVTRVYYGQPGDIPVAR